MNQKPREKIDSRKSRPTTKNSRACEVQRAQEEAECRECNRRRESEANECKDCNGKDCMKCDSARKHVARECRKCENRKSGKEITLVKLVIPISFPD